MRYLLAVSLFAAFPAMADDSAQLTAFSQGRYVEAILMAQDTPSPDNLAFAARSALAQAMSAHDHVLPENLVREGEAYARRALVGDPRHVEGRLQLAVALSLRARDMSTRQALNTGYGSEAKALAASVIDDAPGNAYANAFLSVWHLEVIRRGGGLGAAMMGASLAEADRFYAAAIEAAPDDAAIHWQYARALTALNARRYRPKIDAALDAALSAPVDSELEAVMQARAGALAAALAREAPATCEALAARML